MKYNTIIIGAGIVGLSTALNLKKKYPNKKVLILEKESSFAFHQTGHNSGVIHSGIYYKPGSFKAKNCIEGYNLLLEFVNYYGIKHDICGKVIIATSDLELDSLNSIYHRGIQNGLKGIRKVSKDEVKEIEPYVNCNEGIFVPQTGIIDYKKVSEQLLECFKELGGEILFQEKVIQMIQDDGFKVITKSKEFSSNFIITCGGLQSDVLAKMTDEKVNFKIIPFRGEYYTLKPERAFLVKNLIYPVPNPNFPFLGVHFTRGIDGSIEAGPNAVLAFAKEGYLKKDINFKEFYDVIKFKGFQQIVKKYWREGLEELYRSFSKRAFHNALQKLVPEIKIEDLIVGGSGVRAQACSNEGHLLDDFHIIQNKNSLHVCNAPSPAATSSLSIGKQITEMLNF